MSERTCPTCGSKCEDSACGVEPCAKCARSAQEMLARVMLESFTVGRGGGRQDWEQLAPEQRAGWRAVADMAVMFGYARRHEKPTHHAVDGAELLEMLERVLRELGSKAVVRLSFDGGAFVASLSDGLGKRGAAGTSVAAALRMVLR